VKTSLEALPGPFVVPEVTKKEVREVIKSTRPNKAPGLDGITGKGRSGTFLTPLSGTLPGCSRWPYNLPILRISIQQNQPTWILIQ
jgi:hypothetical protein